MNGRALAIATLLALIVIVGVSSAATSAGDWSGKLKGAKPAVTFSVSASGNKLVVSNFQASGLLKAPCAATEPTSLSGIPAAKVTPRHRFKAVGKQDSAFGVETWTVTGTFRGAHAASGAVTIVLFPAANKPCRFTLRWTAATEAATPPSAGASYSGKMTSGWPVTLHVSADGKTLTSITWHTPLLTNCPGASDQNPPITAYNVPINGSTFTYTHHSGKITDGHGQTGTYSISGQFLAGKKASGEISTSSDIAGMGNVCDGDDTWTAHA
jgi:hypothetical protein